MITGQDFRNSLESKPQLLPAVKVIGQYAANSTELPTSVPRARLLLVHPICLASDVPGTVNYWFPA